MMWPAGKSGLARAWKSTERGPRGCRVEMRNCLRNPILTAKRQVAGGSRLRVPMREHESMAGANAAAIAKSGAG